MDAKQVQGPARDEVYKCLEMYKTNQCDMGGTIYIIELIRSPADAMPIVRRYYPIRTTNCGESR